jgi:hypothetical protein
MTSRRKTYRIIKYSTIDAGFHLVGVSLLVWAAYQWLTVVDAVWIRIALGILVGLPLSVMLRPIVVPVVYIFIAIYRAILSIVRKELNW